VQASLIETNEEVEKDPSLLLRDPEELGWLVILQLGPGKIES